MSTWESCLSLFLKFFFPCFFNHYNFSSFIESIFFILFLILPSLAWTCHFRIWWSARRRSFVSIVVLKQWNSTTRMFFQHFCHRAKLFPSSEILPSQLSCERSSPTGNSKCSLSPDQGSNYIMNAKSACEHRHSCISHTPQPRISCRSSFLLTSYTHCIWFHLSIFASILYTCLTAVNLHSWSWALLFLSPGVRDSSSKWGSLFLCPYWPCLRVVAHDCRHLHGVSWWSPGILGWREFGSPKIRRIKGR